MKKFARRSLALAAVALSIAVLPNLTFGFADTCNARADFTYLNPANFYQIGDVVRVQIALGAGSITGGTHITINRVRFELDCTTAGLPCPDAGNLIFYVGNIGGTCPTSWASSSAGGEVPNEVVFTANTPIVIDAGVSPFCNLEFDIRINAFPAVGTSISEAAGFSIPFNDAVCNTVGNLAAGNQSTGQLTVCNCDDGNVCTTDVCDPQVGCVYTPIVCNDNNVCTTDTCDPAAGCVFTPNPPCDDSNVCTTDTCDPAAGCVFTPNPPCDDNSACTTDVCNPATGCVYTAIDCTDPNPCTIDTCDPVIGCINTEINCEDGNACTAESCSPITGQCEYQFANCDDGDACTDDSCDPAVGCVHTAVVCDDGNVCTTDSCDPAIGCVYVPADPLPQECTLPCRITGGGLVWENTLGTFTTDPTLLASIDRASFGGQVGAPYGIVGCHDNYDQIQGEWTHLRHHRRGSFHASLYNSLVCGCDDGSGGPGVLDGNLCNPIHGDPGPEPRPAPANIACWSGVGMYNRTNGHRAIPVAFRVNVADRGEPGAGSNAGQPDYYRIQIWIPGAHETADGLAAAICCTDPAPDVRAPDVADGGDLIRGNIQIHPPTGNPRNP